MCSTLSALPPAHSFPDASRLARLGQLAEHCLVRLLAAAEQQTPNLSDLVAVIEEAKGLLDQADALRVHSDRPVEVGDVIEASASEAAIRLTDQVLEGTKGGKEVADAGLLNGISPRDIRYLLAQVQQENAKAAARADRAQRKRVERRANPPDREIGLATSAEQRNCFKREGDVWSVRFGAESSKLKDAKGVRYIACLLLHLGEQIPALRLMSDEGPAAAQARRGRRQCSSAEVSTVGRSPQPALDREGRSDIEKQMGKLAQEIEKAREDNAFARVKELQDEFYRLAEEVEKARSFGGRQKEIGPASPDEKARVAVRKAIDRVLARMQKANPSLPTLAAHLKKYIVTEGTSYVYFQPPGTPAWEF